MSTGLGRPKYFEDRIEAGDLVSFRQGHEWVSATVIVVKDQFSFQVKVSPGERPPRAGNAPIWITRPMLSSGFQGGPKTVETCGLVRVVLEDEQQGRSLWSWELRHLKTEHL